MRWKGIALAFIAAASLAHADAAPARADVQRIVDAAIRPVLERNRIPGMAVAVTVAGQRYFFNYGVANRESGQAVSENTLFELGSLSKTFTGLVGAYAQETGAWSLEDAASKVLPALRGTAFDRITVRDLGTYTAGGLPLQIPDEVSDGEKMVAYFRDWKPAYPPGTQRLYSNPSIGLFGELAGRSLGEPFEGFVERKLLPQLGLAHTFLHVPPQRMADYAFGYAKDDRPIRVNPGVLDAQAYGVKSTAADMVRFVELNMAPTGLERKLQRAIVATHTGYYRVGPMTQGLAWEMYPWPTALDPLLEGNSSDMALKPHPVVRLTPPPQPPREDVLLNKTGSTNGFGAYAAFVPAREVGIVMLANRNYPNAARVKAGCCILAAVSGQKVAGSTCD